MTDHDPYGNLDPNQETNERIKAATGLATIDETTINLIATAMHHNHFERISELDTHPDGIRLAESTIESYRRNVAVFGATYVGQPMSTSIYALFDFDTKVAFVLGNLDSWDTLAQNTFPMCYRTCDVRSSILCESEDAIVMMPIKRGDFVCIYKICETCHAWFGLDGEERKLTENSDFAMTHPFADRERIWHKPEEWEGADPWG